MIMTISNNDDQIDSRDIIERIEELGSERDDLQTDIADAVDDIEVDNAMKAWNAWDKEEGQELAALLALQEEAEDYAPDWSYGTQLIRHCYFEQAMDEMVDDCYDLPKIPSFMTITLDYEALKMDYTEVDYDGVTYYIR